MSAIETQDCRKELANVATTQTTLMVFSICVPNARCACARACPSSDLAAVPLALAAHSGQALQARAG